jgi:hypothetical protein
MAIVILSLLFANARRMLSCDVNPLIPAVVAAFFGLAGVVVGGVITFASSYFVESQKAARELKREERTRLATLRLAARIVHGEIADALADVQVTVDNERWPQPLKMSMPDWLVYRTTLAAELPGDQWVTVVRAIIAAETVPQLRSVGTSEGGKLFPSTVSALQQLLPRLDAGREMLQAYCVQ